MAEPKVQVGELYTRGENVKDAIHVPVATVTAGQELYPGQPCMVASEYLTRTNEWDEEESKYTNIATPTTQDQAVGVVDPFLVGPIRKGESFWLFLRPGSVENLSHTWTHKNFDRTTYGTQNDEYYDECRGCF